MLMHVSVWREVLNSMFFIFTNDSIVGLKLLRLKYLQIVMDLSYAVRFSKAENLLHEVILGVITSTFQMVFAAHLRARTSGDNMWPLVHLRIVGHGFALSMLLLLNSWQDLKVVLVAVLSISWHWKVINEFRRLPLLFYLYSSISLTN